MHGLDAAVEAIAVVQVDGHWDARLLGGHLAHGGEVVEVRVLDGAGSGLHDDRGLAVLGGLDDGHHELEALDVESAHGIVAGLGIEQHFLGGYEHLNSLRLPLFRHRVSLAANCMCARVPWLGALGAGVTKCLLNGTPKAKRSTVPPLGEKIGSWPYSSPPAWYFSKSKKRKSADLPLT